MKKLSEMTNEELAKELLETVGLDGPFCICERCSTVREAAARLRKDALVETALNINVGMNNAAATITADLRRRLKIAEDALEKIAKDDLCGHREQAARALSDIRAEGGK